MGMEMKGSSCIIVNDNYAVAAKQYFPINEFESTPHAPIQALIKARKSDVEGGTAYVSKFPCYVCAKALAAAGIRKIVYKLENEFSQADVDKAYQVLNLANIEIVQNEDLEVEMR